MVKGQSDINLIHVCDISEAHDANCIPNLVIQDFRLQKCCTRHKLDKILSHLSNKIWFNLSGNSDRHQVMMKDPITFMARLAIKKDRFPSSWNLLSPVVPWGKYSGSHFYFYCKILQLWLSFAHFGGHNPIARTTTFQELWDTKSSPVWWDKLYNCLDKIS